MMRSALMSHILTVALLTGWPAFAQQAWAPGYGGMWDGGWHGWFIGPVMMILFVIVAVVLVVILVRWLGAPGHTAPHQQLSQHRKPLDILKERFARGEIDKDEFEERRRVLGE